MARLPVDANWIASLQRRQFLKGDQHTDGPSLPRRAFDQAPALESQDHAGTDGGVTLK
jgi:hypothetical protein